MSERESWLYVLWERMDVFGEGGEKRKGGGGGR